jgi:hypothetical protein
MVAHVAYEVAALELTAELFERTSDRFVFEAFLIHARTLRDFFWDKRVDRGKTANHAVAEEFFGDPTTWRAAKGPRSRGVIAVWEPTDRQLTHLTWDRAEPATFRNLERWVPNLASELLGQWGRFLMALPELEAEAFREALDARRREVRTRLATPRRHGSFRNRVVLGGAKTIARILGVGVVDDIPSVYCRARLAVLETARMGVELGTLKEMLLFIEDRAFLTHSGISVRALIRAVAGLVGLWRRSGGSTITQQLVRSLFIKDLHKKYRRKLLEMVLAVWFEGVSSKEEILELYLSSVRFADKVFGVTDAMKHFFGKVLAAPSQAEAFFLVERVSNLRPALLLSKIDHTLRQAVHLAKLDGRDANEAMGIYVRMVSDGHLRTERPEALEALVEKWKLSCQGRSLW